MLFYCVKCSGPLPCMHVRLILTVSGRSGVNEWICWPGISNIGLTNLFAIFADGTAGCYQRIKIKFFKKQHDKKVMVAYKARIFDRLQNYASGHFLYYAIRLL